jgi:hypothetical protein
MLARDGAESVEFANLRVEVKKGKEKEEGPTPEISRNKNETSSPDESTAAAIDQESQDDEPIGLPFSKARCIALVATVAGASFLNVSLAAFRIGHLDTYNGSKLTL